MGPLIFGDGHKGIIMRSFLLIVSADFQCYTLKSLTAKAVCDVLLEAGARQFTG